MQLLPLLLAGAAAAVLTPPGLRALQAAGWTRPNYRGAALPFPAGLLAVAAALVTLAPLGALHALADADVLPPELPAIAVYTLGMAFLGLVDDVIGADPRGWRGHGAAVLRGGLSTGALKAAGALGLAAYVLAGTGARPWEYGLDVAVLVLATNLFNLLDLRPGRSAKAFVLLGAGLTLGTLDADALEAVGLFAAPLLVVAGWDLRERAMLGDTGSNALGGLAGLWIVLALDPAGEAAAAAVMLALTAYGEFRSISATIERLPPLRLLDSLGRPR